MIRLRFSLLGRVMAAIAVVVIVALYVMRH
jgi:hypothetical protein